MDSLTIECSCGYSFTVYRSKNPVNLNHRIECAGKEHAECQRTFSSAEILTRMNRGERVWVVGDEKKDMKL